MMKTDARGIVAALLSAVLMATIGVISRKTGISAESLTFFRLFLGAAFMGVFLIVTGQGQRLRQWPSWPVLLNGVLLAAFMIFYIQAVNLTTMANAIMLIYLAPPVAALGAALFLDEKLSRLGIFLIGLALFGFAMMMEFTFDFSWQGKQGMGLGYGVLALLAYAAFILMNRRIDARIHAYTSTFYQLLAGACVVMPLVWNRMPSLSSDQWLWVASAGLFPGFLGILSAVMALKKLPAATFGALAYIEPVAVVIFGWLIFQEVLSPVQMAGCACIFASGVAKSFYDR